MAFIHSILSGLTLFGKSEVTDDLTDRLHYKLTSGLLVGFAILVSFKQFGGKPIDCLLPHVTDGFDGVEDYAENYCFSQSTYYLRFSEKVEYGDKSLVEKNRAVSYFQWVPFYLVISAAGFQIPYMMWTFLASHSGIRVHDIIGEARDRKNMDLHTKKSTIRGLRIHLENALRFHRRLERKNYLPHRKLRCLNFPYSACYVTSIYLFVKVLYLINVVVQFFLLNRFLTTGNKYSWYGFGVMTDVIQGRSWEETGAFPRVTLCNFQIRGMGNVNQYSLQCVLLINMFNEKIFILLWFWYQILCCLSVFSMFYWFFATYFPCINKGYINRHLVLSSMPFDSSLSRNDVLKFVTSYLHADGIFVIRMVEINAGVIFGSDLVVALWKSYYCIEDEVRKCVLDPEFVPSLPTAPPLPIYDPNKNSPALGRYFSKAVPDSDNPSPDPKPSVWDQKVWKEEDGEYSIGEESEEESEKAKSDSENENPSAQPGLEKKKKNEKGLPDNQETHLMRSKYNYRAKGMNYMDPNDPQARLDEREFKKATAATTESKIRPRDGGFGGGGKNRRL